MDVLGCVNGIEVRQQQCRTQPLMRVNALQLCGFNTKRCLLGHTEPSWSRSKDTECISAAHRAVLPLVALQEKLVGVMLHPGGHQGIKGWLGQHTQQGWEVVVCVMEVSLLFMHVVSAQHTQLSPEKWLVSHQLSHQLTHQSRGTRTCLTTLILLSS